MPSPTQTRAQNAAKKAVGRMLESGKLTRPDHCQKCGRKGRTEQVHSTYLGKNRTSVKFWCPSCHRKADMGVRKPGGPPVKRTKGKAAEGGSWDGPKSGREAAATQQSKGRGVAKRI